MLPSLTAADASNPTLVLVCRGLGRGKGSGRIHHTYGTWGDGSVPFPGALSRRRRRCALHCPVRVVRKWMQYVWGRCGVGRPEEGGGRVGRSGDERPRSHRRGRRREVGEAVVTAVGVESMGVGVGVWVCGGVLGSATEALLRQNRALLLRLVATAPGPGAEIGGSPRTGRWGRRSCRWVPWETAG